LCVRARPRQGTKWGKKGQPGKGGDDSWDRAVRPETLHPKLRILKRFLDRPVRPEIRRGCVLCDKESACVCALSLASLTLAAPTSTPPPSRFHSHTHQPYSEGQYNDGYGNGNYGGGQHPSTPPPTPYLTHQIIARAGGICFLFLEFRIPQAGVSGFSGSRAKFILART